MRFSETEALNYLKVHNHQMSAPSYYRILAHVKGETMKRLYEIAKTLKERHLERIDELDKIKKEMWKNYHQTKDPFDKVKILKEIRDTQPYISAYDESTQKIIQKTVKQFGKEEDIDLSNLGK